MLAYPMLGMWHVLTLYGLKETLAKIISYICSPKLNILLKAGTDHLNAWIFCFWPDVKLRYVLRLRHFGGVWGELSYNGQRKLILTIKSFQDKL